MSALPTAPEAVEIRAAGALEAPVLAALHTCCFADRLQGDGAPWSAAAIARILDLPGAFALLALSAPGVEVGAGAEPAPLGLALARVAADEAEVLSLGVAPMARRTGVGRRLLAAVMAAAQAAGARRLYLEVAEDNSPARGLYGGAGFAMVGCRPEYYRRPGGAAAALIFARDLCPNPE